jgi:hypothetical protein
VSDDRTILMAGTGSQYLQTAVSSGKAPKMTFKELCICSGVPSKKRPQLNKHKKKGCDLVWCAWS